MTCHVAFLAASLKADWVWVWGLSGHKQENKLEVSGCNPLEVTASWTRVVVAANK